MFPQGRNHLRARNAPRGAGKRPPPHQPREKNRRRARSGLEVDKGYLTLREGCHPLLAVSEKNSSRKPAEQTRSPTPRYRIGVRVYECGLGVRVYECGFPKKGSLGSS